jgi:polyhydroxybutyrate depolymerase
MNIDDMAFVKAIVARMHAADRIDPKKIFAFGYSNGGQMAFRLAIESPGDVMAVAAVSANLPVPDNFRCAPSGRTARVMLVDGTADPINPYGGGMVSIFHIWNRGLSISAPATAEHFAARNAVAAAPVTARLPHLHTDDPTSVDREIWSDGRTPVVAFYTVHGGGHVVPQPAFRFPRLVGRTTGDLDAPEAALQFFGLAPR